jgi:hypothetical protein
MRLLDLFRKKAQPTPQPRRVQSKVPVFLATGLDVRAQQWRETPTLVANARRIVTDVGFVQMLEVLRTENPGNFAFDPSAGLAERATQQAKTEGYNLAINLMLSLAEPWKNAELPEETYAPEVKDG